MTWLLLVGIMLQLTLWSILLPEKWPSLSGFFEGDRDWFNRRYQFCRRCKDIRLLGHECP